MHTSCDGCGRIFKPGEIIFDGHVCAFCDAGIAYEPFEYPHCPICGTEMWCLMDVWYCYRPEDHPAGSEVINGENIAPPYKYFE